MSRPFVPGGPPRYAHQKRGLRRLIRQKGVGALLMDPGTGKTATTIDFLSVLALKRESEVRVLVICPLAATDTWVTQMETWVAPGVNYWAEVLGGSMIEKAEALAARGGQAFKRPLKGRSYPRTALGTSLRALHHRRAATWATRPETLPTRGPESVPEPRIVLEVVNIDVLGRRDGVGSRTQADVFVDAIKRFAPDVIVLDESHKAKSASSNISRFMARLTKIVDMRIILTGTVMPAGPLDVFGQWRFLDPYAFSPTEPDGSKREMTFGRFKARYAVLGGYMGKEVVGFQNIDEMQEIMAEKAIVVRKEDALDLPKTTEVDLPVTLSAAEKKAYTDMVKDLSTNLSPSVTSTTSSNLTQMMRLRQITSGHLPDDTGRVRRIGHSKVNKIKSLVQDTLVGEKRVVIFALFTEEIHMLEEALSSEKDTEVLVISGATPKPERLELRKRFGSDDPTRMILVAQIKTLSLAVNELVTANHAIFASLSQQRDDLIQAKDRLNRIGQTRPMTFWYAVAPGSIDEVILRSHRERTDLESSVLEHVRSYDG